MSLPTFSAQSSLFALTAPGPQLFGPTDRYRLFSQKVYPLLVKTRTLLEKAYCANNGRPATEPVWLIGTTLLQFIEGIPDRQAVELLKYHLGWNFALNRSVGEPVFHPTTLVCFRDRLIAHKAEAVVFAQMLEALIEAGLVERRGKQRLDSTHVLGLVSRMSRLECVRESLGLALRELEQSAELFAKPHWWQPLRERYIENKLDYRTEAGVLKDKMNQAGVDGLKVLDWVKSLSDQRIGRGAQVQLLRRVLEENFTWEPGQAPVQREAQPTGAVHNPHDPQAQWAAKGQGKQRKEFVGYKMQVAETVHPEGLAKAEPTRSFLTGIATHEAPSSDEAGGRQMEAEQAAMGLEKPEALYVDAAYVSGKQLAQAQAEGRQLIGPAQAAPRKPGRFSSDEFVVNVEERVATCPAGKANTQCGRLDEQTGKVNYRFEWTSHCPECPLRQKCVGKGQTHRTLLVGEYHTPLQARRQEQRTEAFRKQCHNRNALEGTHSELVRAHGLRHARYRGLAKVRLQGYFSGAACNAKRWIKRIIWEYQTGRLEPAGLSG